MRTRERPRRSGPRAATIARKKITRQVLRDGRAEVGPELERLEEERPRTRADCVDGMRPCPFVGCRYNLYLDVDPNTGSIKLNFPHLEPWNMAESCALDVADRGPSTLELVGSLCNITRERTRQIETRAFDRFKAAGADGEHELDASVLPFTTNHEEAA